MNEFRKKEIDFSYFKKITDSIYEKSGIVDLDKRVLTGSRLQQFAISKNIYNTDEFLFAIKVDKVFYQEVLNIATVNETFFFREIKELYWLIEYIKKEDRRLKILSMPCSSGEEIYSILLLMSINNIDINQVEFIGYDINSDAIKKAIEGVYDMHSLHKLDEQIKLDYFIKNENLFSINEKLKQNIEFKQQNIFDLKDSDDRFDIVLSRNMFIYFDEEKRKIALDIIVNLLKVKGIYIKGHADHIYKHPNLKNLEYGIYKKQ